MSERELDVVGTFREVQEDIKNLYLSLEQLEAAQKAANAANVSSAVVHLKQLRDANEKDIDRRLSELTVTVDNPEYGLRNRYGDSTTRLRNLWNDIWGIWLSAGDSVEAYCSMKEPVSTLLRECAYLTIPIRLDGNLKTMRVGQAIDFYKEFDDEVPNHDLLQKVLDWIYDHPLVTTGFVDKTRGVVLKGSPDALVRTATYLGELAVVIVCFLLLRFRTDLGLRDLLLSSEKSDVALGQAFLWAFCGFVIHFVVGAVKEVQRQAATGGESPSAGNWFLLLHVMYLRVALSIGLVLAATIAAVAATHGTDAFTLIAAGYAFDSIGDVALKKSIDALGKRSESLAGIAGA